MLITVTPLIEAGGVVAPPDIVWNGRVGDFVLDDTRGLSSSIPLETAVIMLLFTDAPADENELRYDHAGDFRGWPGDALGDAPLGSKLWLYRRSELTNKTVLLVQAEIRRALQPLIDTGLAARVDVSAERALNRIDAEIAIYGRDGSQRYADRFELLWQGR